MCSAGALLLLLVAEEATWARVLPGMIVFALGLALLVSPLTAAVLAAAPDRYAGAASGVNNAVARAGSLLAVAALPALVGLVGDDYLDPEAMTAGYRGAMLWCAALLALGVSSAGSASADSTAVTKSDTVSCQSEASRSMEWAPPSTHVPDVDTVLGEPPCEDVGASRVGDAVAAAVHEQHGGARPRASGVVSTHGARAATPITSGSVLRCSATRPPIEWPTRTTGMPGRLRRIGSSAQRASVDGVLAVAVPAPDAVLQAQDREVVAGVTARDRRGERQHPHHGKTPPPPPASGSPRRHRGG